MTIPNEINRLTNQSLGIEDDDLCATCSHGSQKHIYCEGACRPGFICFCTKFVSRETKPKRISFETKIYEKQVFTFGGLFNVGAALNMDLVPFIGKRVRVTVEEIL